MKFDTLEFAKLDLLVIDNVEEINEFGLATKRYIFNFLEKMQKSGMKFLLCGDLNSEENKCKDLCEYLKCSEAKLVKVNPLQYSSRKKYLFSMAHKDYVSFSEKEVRQICDASVDLRLMSSFVKKKKLEPILR